MTVALEIEEAQGQLELSGPTQTSMRPERKLSDAFWMYTYKVCRFLVVAARCHVSGCGQHRRGLRGIVLCAGVSQPLMHEAAGRADMGLA